MTHGAQHRQGYTHYPYWCDDCGTSHTGDDSDRAYTLQDGGTILSVAYKRCRKQGGCGALHTTHLLTAAHAARITRWDISARPFGREHRTRASVAPRIGQRARARRTLRVTAATTSPTYVLEVGERVARATVNVQAQRWIDAHYRKGE